MACGADQSAAGCKGRHFYRTQVTWNLWEQPNSLAYGCLPAEMEKARSFIVNILPDCFIAGSEKTLFREGLSQTNITNPLHWWPPFYFREKLLLFQKDNKVFVKFWKIIVKSRFEMFVLNASSLCILCHFALVKLMSDFLRNVNCVNFSHLHQQTELFYFKLRMILLCFAGL